MRKTLGDYLFILISIFGSLASIIALGLFFMPKFNLQGWVGIAFLGVITLFFIGYNLYLISKYRKRIRYADALEDLNVGFAELHRVEREDITDVTSIVEKLKALCTSTSDVFSKIYGHHISVCVKAIEQRGDRYVAHTLFRDRKTFSKRKSGKEDTVVHWVDENTDFHYIHSKFDDDAHDTSYYHQTKLPLRDEYKNTRLPKDWPPKKMRIFNNLYRRTQWKLPYRSTLVVAIVPLFANEHKQSNIRGFFCLDSPRMSCFNTTFDVDILRGISDGLYNSIDRLNTLTVTHGT